MSSLASQPVPSVPDNFAYVIPVDEIEHSPLRPFCYDPTCPCHEDEEAIDAIYQALQDGFISAEEATDLVLGRLL